MPHPSVPPSFASRWPPTAPRLLAAQLDYEPDDLAMLLRALQTSPMAERLATFVNVRHCRRRAAVDWKMHAIARLFSTEDEYKLLHLRALLSRARVGMRRRRLTPLEFVHFCDRDADGYVTRAELQSALRWLGVDVGPDLIVELMEMLDRRPPGSGPPGVLEQRHLLEAIPNVGGWDGETDSSETDDAGGDRAGGGRGAPGGTKQPVVPVVQEEEVTDGADGRSAAVGS